jgi:hypothetical protein
VVTAEEPLGGSKTWNIWTLVARMRLSVESNNFVTVTCRVRLKPWKLDFSVSNHKICFPNFGHS